MKLTSQNLKTQVVLVGPMGAGKTTIGKMLAKALKFEFYDSDREIVKRSGADIPWIFDVEGEEGFRHRETLMLEELCEKDGIVLATGGGAILKEENRELISRKGVIVYLKTSVERQYLRTSRDKNRPLLQKDDPKKILTELFEIRNPIYESIADILLVTDKMNPKSIVRHIVQHVHEYGLQL
jgi:shikimate kinase